MNSICNVQKLLLNKINKINHSELWKKNNKIKLNLLMIIQITVGYFMLSLFKNLNNNIFDIICYSTRNKEDNYTEKLKNMLFLKIVKYLTMNLPI